MMRRDRSLLQAIRRCTGYGARTALAVAPREVPPVPAVRGCIAYEGRSPVGRRCRVRQQLAERLRIAACWTRDPHPSSARLLFTE